MRTTDSSRNSPSARAKWESAASGWAWAGPPASPSNDDLRGYEKFLKRAAPWEASEEKALVLGVTPSLRLLLSELGYRATCVDLSENMTRASLVALPRLPDEELLLGDWLKLEGEAASFAVVIGDKVLDNLPISAWQSFKEQVVHFLRPGGIFVTRTAPVNPSLIGLGFEELVARWGDRYEREETDLGRAASGLWEEGLGASTAEVPGMQSLSRFKPQIEQLQARCAELSAPQREVFEKFLTLFGATVGHQWTGYRPQDVMDTFAADLSYVGLRHSNDYKAAPHQPIVAFRANTAERQPIGPPGR